MERIPDSSQKAWVAVQATHAVFPSQLTMKRFRLDDGPGPILLIVNPLKARNLTCCQKGEPRDSRMQSRMKGQSRSRGPKAGVAHPVKIARVSVFALRRESVADRGQLPHE